MFCAKSAATAFTTTCRAVSSSWSTIVASAPKEDAIVLRVSVSGAGFKWFAKGGVQHIQIDAGAMLLSKHASGMPSNRQHLHS